MMVNSRKSPNNVKSHKPTSNLLLIVSMYSEKLLFKRLKPLIQENLISEHQHSFHAKLSTIDQDHRITNIVEEASGGKSVKDIRGRRIPKVASWNQSYICFTFAIYHNYDTTITDDKVL